MERIQNKVQGWKRQILSLASRICLIRTVAAATPIYPMSSLIFPKSTCVRIDAILRDFWWGKKENKGVLYLKEWDSNIQYVFLKLCVVWVLGDPLI